MTPHDGQGMRGLAHGQGADAALRVAHRLIRIPGALRFVEDDHAFMRRRGAMGVVGQEAMHVLQGLRGFMARLAQLGR